MLTLLLTVLPALQAPAGCAEPAAVTHLSSGTLGSSGQPRLTLTGPPLVGGRLDLRVDNARSQSTGLFAAGLETVLVPLPTYGTVLRVRPGPSPIVFSTDAAGRSPELVALPEIPPEFCGIEAFAQALVIDPLAPGGAAFTDTLGLCFGAASGPGFAGEPFLSEESIDLVQGLNLNGDGLTDVVAWDEEARLLRTAIADPEQGYVAGPVIDPGEQIENLWAVDYNADGLGDLVLLGAGFDTVLFMDGTGAGGFSSRPPVPIPASGSLIIQDVDGDGDLDVVAYRYDDELPLILGDGAGGFALVAPIALAVPLELLDHAAFADTDGDGLPDLVLTRALEITTLPGLGGGLFGSSLASQNSLVIRASTLGDFDRDGTPDIALGLLTWPPRVALRRGLGNGLFEAPVEFFSFDTVRELRTADLNGDGWPDLLLGMDEEPGLLGMLNDQSGGLLSPASIHADVFPGGDAQSHALYVLGDTAGDGIDDLIVRNDLGGFRTYAGRGDGSFVTLDGLLTTGSPAYVASGDFDGDGLLDLAVSNWKDFEVMVLFGDGQGAFPERTVANSLVGSIEVADFNNDGLSDLALTHLEVWAPEVQLFFGSGDRTLAPGTPVSSPGLNKFSVSLDYDGDGNEDLAVLSDLDPGHMRLFRGDGTGNFDTGLLVPLGGRPSRLDAGDLNGDGLDDLVVANPELASLQVLLADPLGGFQALQEQPLGVRPRNLILGQFDDDPAPDLAVYSTELSGPSAQSLDVLPGRGDGSFDPAVHVAELEFGAKAMAAANFGADGRMDLLVLNTRNCSLWYAEGPNVFGAPVEIPSGVPWWPFNSLAVADFDRDGQLDIATPDGEPSKTSSFGMGFVFVQLGRSLGLF